MKYELRLNGNYMNRFETYGEAIEVRDNLQRKFKNAKIEIIAL